MTLRSPNSVLRFGLSVVLALSGIPAAWAAERPVAFEMDPNFLKPPAGMSTIGDSHGDIAVSPAGEIYVSVEGGPRPGIQVYGADGHYLRNVPNAPNDFHGFIITTVGNAKGSIFGARLMGQQILHLGLDGRLLLAIPATAIPDQYKTNKDGTPSLHLTGVAVAPNGDIYAVDGYGLDFIHRFDRSGRYLETFGGHSEPWNFNICHKIAIDSRFRPARLVCADREHGRLVQMDLHGRVLGVISTAPRSPSALAIYHNELAVAELGGRVTVLGLHGDVLGYIGTNSTLRQVKTNEISPHKWQPSLFYAPHGIAYDSHGNLLVTEWNKWGRVVRLIRDKRATEITE